MIVVVKAGVSGQSEISTAAAHHTNQVPYTCPVLPPQTSYNVASGWLSLIFMENVMSSMKGLSAVVL